MIYYGAIQGHLRLQMMMSSLCKPRKDDFTFAANTLVPPHLCTEANTIIWAALSSMIACSPSHLWAHHQQKQHRRHDDSDNDDIDDAAADDDDGYCHPHQPVARHRERQDHFMVDDHWLSHIESLSSLSLRESRRSTSISTTATKKKEEWMHTISLLLSSSPLLSWLQQRLIIDEAPQPARFGRRR
jgi:hypothetical protein